MPKSMKVLIGYDGSTCADEALDDLSIAGLPEDTEVMVLSVADVSTPPTQSADAIPADDQILPGMAEARTMSAELMEHAEAMAQTARDRIQSEFPQWHVHAQVSAGSPASGLIHKAETWEADLIIVGSHGRSPLGRFILGSVSQTLVTQAHIPVRVARSRQTEQSRPPAILVGFDGSAQAELAARAVAERNWPHGTSVRLVTAVDPMLVTAVASTEPVLRWQREEFQDARIGVEHMLEETAASMRARNRVLEISLMFDDGDPKHLLLKEAERWEADCIFVGARGQNRLQRLLLGSVSAAVTARAHCSVEVVRPLPTHSAQN